MVTPRETIEKLIRESSDDAFPEGTYWRSRGFLGRIDFSDFMGIVLYRIGLEPDLEKVATVTTHDFWDIVEEAWKEWRERLKNSWGYRKTERASVPYVGRRVSAFLDIDDAWSNGPGPMGGTMGAAEMYAILHPGFTTHKYLLQFFRFPETLRDKGEYGNWPRYKLEIERMKFPKFPRKKHFKKLGIILDFAEDVCERLRSKVSK